MKNFTAETFINKWWANPLSALSYDVEDWIEKSYIDPKTFLKDVVFSEQDKILPPSQSILEKTYNFYHDCILRHIRSNSTALSIFKEKNIVENWSYEKLHHCVNFHVEKWSYYSPQPDQLIAIVATPGIHFLISLLTALRFGLKICYLPTNSPFLGKSLISKILFQLKPRLIAAEDGSFSTDGIPLLTVDEQKFDEENHTPHSFAYPASSVMQITLALQRQAAQTFVSLDAHTVYSHALRDALFTLNLIHHPLWASPLACPIRTEPCNTFMSLLCGITRIYVPDETIRKDPLILEDERIHLLGISNSLQQLWTQVPGMPTRSLKCCYKDFIETTPYSWKTFEQLNRLEKISHFHLLMDNSLGGITVFSKPTLETFNFFLKPTLGNSWSLSHVDGRDEKTLTGFGLLNIHLSDKENEKKKGNLTFTQIEKNLMMTGFIEPCQEGITFPIVELEEIVNGLPFVEVCMIHPIKKADKAFNSCFVLLVFVNPMLQEVSENDKKDWLNKISLEISEKLGSGFLPDQIDYFPLLPKMQNSKIDRSWCANQYNSGLFSRKKHLSMYQVLGALKKLAQKMVSNEKTT